MRIRSILVLSLVAALMSACSTPRTKWTDKTMRVMIDPDSIEANHYVRIQKALVESGKFVVVDRAAAFRAIKKEQEMLHRDEADRFLDREKYAHWGKLYGVGGVVVAHAQCQDRWSNWSSQYYKVCLQYISIVDTNTGEVLATAEAEGEARSGLGNQAPEWSDVVDKLIDNYPKYVERDKTEKPLAEYKSLSQEEAIRQKEEAAKQEIERSPANTSKQQKAESK